MSTDISDGSEWFECVALRKCGDCIWFGFELKQSSVFKLIRRLYRYLNNNLRKLIILKKHPDGVLLVVPTRLEPLTSKK
jgi:hypothetical protein